MFTKEEYADVMDRLIIRLQTVKSFFDPIQTREAFSEICALLRVGKITVKYFQTPAHEMINQAMESVLYDCGSADESPEREMKMREDVENGAVTHYIFCPAAGEPEWTADERSKIEMLHRIIFVYVGRANLITVANNLAFNDITLGVRNQAYMARFIGELIAKRAIGDYGAVFFNLRRFSVVNNQVGREDGTNIMRKYIQGLKNKLSEEECVCRMGGDNFFAIFYKKNLNTVVEHLSGVKIKSDIHRAEFLIGAYSGFYMIEPADIKRPADVMDRASVASGIAKKRLGADNIVFYNTEIEERVKRSKQIEDMIPDALKNDEFLVYYQPKVSMKDYTLTGAEALCRWRHDGVMIQPMQFIPVLERSKLICELDFYMLDHVCRDLRRWMDEGKDAVKISVNLSRVHLGDTNLLDNIIGIIDRHNVPHEYIEIELTETTTDVDYGELKKLVTGLRGNGISTSVDDFGVGYSSLSLISELPWNVLKIDKSFLPDGTGNDNKKRTMLKHVIAMAQEIGLKCIVEGVETIDQIILLKEYGCFLAQGYYFDRPLPKEEFEGRLSSESALSLGRG